MDELLISKIVAFLKEESNFKWVTSQTLKSKLNITAYSTNAIENTLLSFYNSTLNPSIRYSSLPSRKTLQVLWGHVDNVGHRKLFDIFKEDIHLEADYLNTVDDERNIFLSHSFKDTEKVFNLARQLVMFNLNPWIAEVDIEQYSNINQDVIYAIENLPFFGIYLSKHVLESAWSAKEFAFATLNKKKLFAFVDEHDHDMINLIENNVPIKHLNIHGLLKEVFDHHDFSEQIDFFLISKSQNAAQIYNRIKPTKQINDIILG